MARRKKHRQDVDNTDVVMTEEQMVVRLTPNQVVAFNLAQARAWRDWTQDEAAEHLEPFLGARWSRATFSAAERSVDGQRVRQFSADEIVAFARGFNLPVGFFFLPPPPSVAAPWPLRLASPQHPYWGITMAEMVDLVVGTPGDLGFMGMRIQEFFRQESTELQTEVQRRLRMQTEAVLEAIVAKQLHRFAQWRTALTTVRPAT